MKLGINGEHTRAHGPVDATAMPHLMSDTAAGWRNVCALLVGSLYYLASSVVSYGASLEACINAKDTADAIRECTALSQFSGFSSQGNIALHLRLVQNRQKYQQY